MFHLIILSCQSIQAAVDNTKVNLWPGCAGNVDTYMSGSEAGAHSQDLSPLTPGHSMAQITPGGLRLYDAKGACSMVPLEELKQIMGKLSFSRYMILSWGEHRAAAHLRSLAELESTLWQEDESQHGVLYWHSDCQSLHLQATQLLQQCMTMQPHDAAC